VSVLGAREILLAIAVIFALVAGRRWYAHRGALTIQERTWLLIAAIFAAVSAFLFAWRG